MQHVYMILKRNEKENTYLHKIENSKLSILKHVSPSIFSKENRMFI